MWALATCLGIAVLYVVPLNTFGGSLPRNHPRTIRRRTLCVLTSCLLAWLPVLYLAKVRPAGV